ncbi:hypothetical protein HPULCUR_000115 [Helicostylum pulchrum]|uniref:Uncharacterized protein n=1 Tax=Helicostylum pulchrum TaxID=562976 RepID=A0ABP9XIY0_9FUNG
MSIRIEQYSLLEERLEEKVVSSSSSKQPKDTTTNTETFIFTEAQKLHKLKSEERCRMVAGLSGIVNLTSDRGTSQESLFSSEVWGLN